MGNNLSLVYPHPSKATTTSVTPGPQLLGYQLKQRRGGRTGDAESGERPADATARRDTPRAASRSKTPMRRPVPDTDTIASMGNIYVVVAVAHTASTIAKRLSETLSLNPPVKLV
jgi:hypothetical protein